MGIGDAFTRVLGEANSVLVRRQIQHMIKYRYVPFTFVENDVRKLQEAGLWATVQRDA